MRERILALVVLLSGCGGAERASARAAVLATAEGVKQADTACAAIALEKADLPLARRCEKSYDAARIVLVATASGVDAWEKPEARRSVTCAVREASSILGAMVEDVRRAGGRVPELVDDALQLVAALGSCPGGAR